MQFEIKELVVQSGILRPDLKTELHYKLFFFSLTVIGEKYVKLVAEKIVF